MNLQTKYSLTILSLTLCLVVFFTAIVLIQSRSTISTLSSVSSRAMEKEMLEEINKRAELVVKVLAADLRNPVYQFDMENVSLLIRNVKEQPDVTYVHVYDTTNHIIHDGTTELMLFGQPLDDGLSKETLTARRLVSQTEGDNLHVAFPIMIENQLLGGVKVGFSLREITSNIAQMKADLSYQQKKLERRDLLAIIIMACGFAFLGLLSAVYLARSWSRPISLLSDLTTRVGKGDYDVRIPIQRSDEIGQLATSFGQMVENLKELRAKETKHAHDLREAYQQLQQTNEELVRANKAKDEFLSVISHELKTPLNVIMGYTGMIRDRILGEINPEQDKALAKVVSRSNELLAMIMDILHSTSIEAETIVVEPEEIELCHFLEELRAGYELPLDKELDFHRDFPQGPVLVKTDPAKLKHILQNLINNAVKFTPNGHVTISARPCPTTNKLEFKVTDTGIGIPEDAMPFIFDRFRQVDSSETRLYGGVGIGLYVAKKLTDLLGGKIDVKSAPGKGSTFIVTIPT